MAPHKFGRVTAQWVELEDGQVLVASHDGAWIQPPQPATLSLWGSMPASLPATSQTTRHLVDGAIAAAQRAASTPGEEPLFSERTWALHLVDQWYTAHHSVALLPIAIERYDSMGRRELAGFARFKLEEETGHDLMPLDDLRALGYDSGAVTEQVPPGHMARALVEYARECVLGPLPVRFLGYIYALERRVIGITRSMLRELAQVLPEGVDAMSGLRAHALEFDHQHVEELVEFVTALSAADRTEVALACHHTAAICCAPSPSDCSDTERQERLSRLQPTH